MVERSAAAAGSYASALPAKPPRRNTTTPEALSTSEGSGSGLPACSHALPEAQPLTGVPRNGSTSTSTKHKEGTSGLGKNATLTPELESSSPHVVDGPETEKDGDFSTADGADDPTASTPTFVERTSLLSRLREAESAFRRQRSCRKGRSRVMVVHRQPSHLSSTSHLRETQRHQAGLQAETHTKRVPIVKRLQPYPCQRRGLRYETERHRWAWWRWRCFLQAAWWKLHVPPLRQLRPASLTDPCMRKPCGQPCRRGANWPACSCDSESHRDCLRPRSVPPMLQPPSPSNPLVQVARPVEGSREVSSVHQISSQKASNPSGLVSNREGRRTLVVFAVMRRKAHLKTASPPFIPPKPLGQVAWTVEEPRAVFTVSYLFPLEPRLGSNWKRCRSLVGGNMVF